MFDSSARSHAEQTDASAAHAGRLHEGRGEQCHEADAEQSQRGNENVRCYHVFFCSLDPASAGASAGMEWIADCAQMSAAGDKLRLRSLCDDTGAARAAACATPTNATPRQEELLQQ